MTQVTNELVAKAKKFVLPAALVAAFGLGAAMFAGHGNVQAAASMDDESVAALTALDHAMEAVTAKVTPAVVYVAVTSKSSGEMNRRGADAEPASGAAAVLRAHVSGADAAAD